MGSPPIAFAATTTSSAMEVHERSPSSGSGEFPWPRRSTAYTGRWPPTACASPHDPVVSRHPAWQTRGVGDRGSATLDDDSPSIDELEARPGLIPSDPKRWTILAVLCLALLIVGIDGTIVNVALPTLVRDIGASSSELQWIVDAYTIIFASMLLIAGNTGDRLGRKWTLIVGLVIFGGGLARLLAGEHRPTP